MLEGAWRCMEVPLLRHAGAAGVGAEKNVCKEVKVLKAEGAWTCMIEVHVHAA